MKRIIPILVVALLIVALIFVNKGISKTAKPDDDDDAQTQTTRTASTASTTKAPPVAPTAPGSELLPEVTIGDASKAKLKITVGWIYDEKDMTDPQPLIQAIQAVQHAAESSGGTTSAEIVDLDVPASELSPAAASVTGLGVVVNGSAVGPSVNPGTDSLTGAFLSKTLSVPPH